MMWRPWRARRWCTACSFRSARVRRGSISTLWWTNWRSAQLDQKSEVRNQKSEGCNEIGLGSFWLLASDFLTSDRSIAHGLCGRFSHPGADEEPRRLSENVAEGGRGLDGAWRARLQGVRGRRHECGGDGDDVPEGAFHCGRSHGDIL